MSITRRTANNLTNFSIWCAQYLVPRYFKYWELYSYSSTVYGIDFYRDAPVFSLTEEEPDDWSTNYNDYYTREDDNYIKNEFESAQEWESGVYYARIAPTQKALRIGKDPSNDQKMSIQVWKAIGTKSSLATGSLNLPSSYLMFSCDGGSLIRISSDGAYVFDIIIAKTINGETAVIFNGASGTVTPTGAMYKTDVNAVAWNDDALADKKLTWIDQEQNQTQLVPFTTYAKYGEISYTPTAYYCPKSSVYALRNHTVVYDEVYYVTNGYWMIKDEFPVVPDLTD